MFIQAKRTGAYHEQQFMKKAIPTIKAEQFTVVFIPNANHLPTALEFINTGTYFHIQPAPIYLTPTNTVKLLGKRKTIIGKGNFLEQSHDLFLDYSISNSSCIN